MIVYIAMSVENIISELINVCDVYYMSVRDVFNTKCGCINMY
jgi:hypothetical protein